MKTLLRSLGGLALFLVLTGCGKQEAPTSPQVIIRESFTDADRAVAGQTNNLVWYIMVAVSVLLIKAVFDVLSSVNKSEEVVTHREERKIVPDQKQPATGTPQTQPQSKAPSPMPSDDDPESAEEPEDDRP